MKKVLFILFALVFSFTAFSQYDSTKLLQSNYSNGFDYFRSLKVRGGLIGPTDTPKLAVRDSGGIAVKNNKFYYFNGYYWIEAGGGSGLTIQQAIDNGDAFDKNNTLNANGYDLKIDNLKSFVLDSLENTFLYSDTKGVFTITNVEGGITQKLQFENQPGHFTISHGNGNAFVKFDRADSLIKIYNSGTSLVRDTVAYLSDVRASIGIITLSGGSDSYTFPSGKNIEKVAITEPTSINVDIGTTVSGTEIANDVPVTTGKAVFSFDYYTTTSTTLYFSNITSNTVIKIYTR